jgi:hypothetical protein
VLPRRRRGAMVNLGVLLARHDAPGQVAWFARAVDTGDSEIAPVAALYLASWYQGRATLSAPVTPINRRSPMSIPTPRRGPPTCWAALRHAHGRIEEGGRQGRGRGHGRHLRAVNPLAIHSSGTSRWYGGKSCWEGLLVT